MCVFTCVIKQGGDEGAVLEEGVAGGDILKVTLLEQRVLEHHGPHPQVHKSASDYRNGTMESRNGGKEKMNRRNMEVGSGGRQKGDAKSLSTQGGLNYRTVRYSITISLFEFYGLKSQAEFRLKRQGQRKNQRQAGKT